MQPQKSGRSIQSVQRAIDIINCFEDNESELTLAQISAALNLNKSTVHGILNTLYQNDFVRQNSSGRYMLGGYFARRFGPADASIRNLLKETALEGMARFRRDPYALSVHRLGAGIFVNGLSINDPQSTCAVWDRLREKYGWEERELILLVNNRPDRGSRTQDMVQVCRALGPAQVWLMGASQGYMRRALRRSLPSCPVLGTRDPGTLPAPEEHQVVFAVGNLAGRGRQLLARVREEGTSLG